MAGTHDYRLDRWRAWGLGAQTRLKYLWLPQKFLFVGYWLPKTHV